MMPRRALRPPLRRCPPPARDPDRPQPVQGQTRRRGPRSTTPAPCPRAPSRPATLATGRPPPADCHQPLLAQAGLAIAAAQPPDAAPLAQRAGPAQVGRLPRTTTPPPATSSQRAPPAHPEARQGERTL